MWIEQRNGKYRMYERYTDPVTDKVHKISVSFDKDTAQQRNKAKAKLDDLLAKRKRFVYDLSFHALTEFYLHAKSKEVKLSTLRRVTYECGSLNRILGDVIVDDLTAGYVKARFMKDSPNPTTVNEHIQRFKEIIRWGYQNDFVDNCRFIDKLVKLKDKSKHEKARYKFLERDECAKLIDAMSGSNRYLTRFLILSGCRVGEALALCEKDLDFANREISITKTKDPVGGEITSPKTAASVRQVFMQDDLYDLCEEIIEYNKTLKNRKGDWLFWNQYQEPMEYRGYKKYLEQYSDMVLNKKVSPHVLRHTHASILAENLDFEQIQRRLGHENSRITREIYIHVTKKQKEKDREAMKNLKIV